MMLNITAHAAQRMAQRNVSIQDVQFILTWGFLAQCAGVVHIHLREKDVPHRFQHDDRRTRLIGVTLVTSRDVNSLITVWRNRKQGLRRIRRKQ